MNKMLQVRNLSAETHKKAKMRAAEEGLTLTDWVERLIEQEVGRPSMAEVFARLKTRPSMKLGKSAAEIIREERDSR
jgi:plasmid stability protein